MKIAADLGDSLRHIVNRPEFADEINLLASRLAFAQAHGNELAFSSQLASTIGEALETTRPNSKSFDSVERLVELKQSELPRDRASLEGLARLIMILTFLVMLIQTYLMYQQREDSKASSERQAASIQLQENQTEYLKQQTEALERILSRIEAHLPVPDPNTYYIIERTVDLRSNPSFKSAHLNRLFPNQKVKLIRRKHSWLYVEVFDYLEGLPRCGWLSKKYSRIF